MNGIVSQHEFLQVLQRSFGATTVAAEELLPFYNEAARAAALALPRVPKLGFFSSQDEKVSAFVSICLLMDKQVENGDLSPDGTQVALMLLMVSDKHFYTATKAFANYAYQFRNRIMTSDSDTVMRWFNSGLANQ